MTFEEIQRAHALIGRRGDLVSLLDLVDRDASRTQLYITAPGESEIIKREIGMEPEEARAVLKGRIAVIDEQLAKWYIWPPAPAPIEPQAAA